MKYNKLTYHLICRINDLYHLFRLFIDMFLLLLKKRQNLYFNYQNMFQNCLNRNGHVVLFSKNKNNDKKDLHPFETRYFIFNESHYVIDITEKRKEDFDALNYAKYFIPTKHREEIIGDLFELRQEMEEKNLNKWFIKSVLLFQLFMIFIGSIKMKFSDLYTPSKKERTKQ